MLGLGDGPVVVAVVAGGEAGLGATGITPVAGVDVAGNGGGRLPRPRLMLGRGWPFLAAPGVLPGLLVAVWRKGLSGFWYPGMPLSPEWVEPSAAITHRTAVPPMTAAAPSIRRACTLTVCAT